MVRAIAATAVTEALSQGDLHVSFRGFRLCATRQPQEDVECSVARVELVIWLDGQIFDREMAEILPPNRN